MDALPVQTLANTGWWAFQDLYLMGSSSISDSPYLNFFGRMYASGHSIGKQENGLFNALRNMGKIVSLHRNLPNVKQHRLDAASMRTGLPPHKS